MKKLLISLVFCLFVDAYSQIHFLYDFNRQPQGYGSNFSSISYDFIKPDTFGYTFYTIDFYFRCNQVAYMELSRNVILFKNLALHAEFDGGLYYINNNIGGVVHDAFLFGLSIPLTLGVNYLEFQILPKKYSGYTVNDDNTYNYYKGLDGQITMIWNIPISKKFLFNGYIDIWSQKLDSYYNFDPLCKRNYVILSEPQLSYNINKIFTLETRHRISQHFSWNIKSDGTIYNKFSIFPCIGLKINL